ncbi:hypothetical protein F5888DRAFT_102332 [Russula emetica]|nr:hypothetical protein F5888DRAFT_102332 [Russula emetica]
MMMMALPWPVPASAYVSSLFGLFRHLRVSLRQSQTQSISSRLNGVIQGGKGGWGLRNQKCSNQVVIHVCA